MIGKGCVWGCVGVSQNRYAKYLINRIETKMILMKPVLADAALYHFYLLFCLWIRIRAAACAVCSFKVKVISVIDIFGIFCGTKLAAKFPKL